MKLIGTYSLGTENVDLFHDPHADGAWFSTRPDLKNKARIGISIHTDDNWTSILNRLLHELLELSMLRHGSVFRDHAKYSNDCADRLFVMDHPKFAEVCFVTACFISECLPDVREAFEKITAKKKK